MSWERIYTVDKFCDGPLPGVADFGGSRHIYERIFDERLDDWTDRFWLAPVDGDLVALIIEQEKIGKRWV